MGSLSKDRPKTLKLSLVMHSLYAFFWRCWWNCEHWFPLCTPQCFVSLFKQELKQYTTTKQFLNDSCLNAFEMSLDKCCAVPASMCFEFYLFHVTSRRHNCFLACCAFPHMLYMDRAFIRLLLRLCRLCGGRLARPRLTYDKENKVATKRKTGPFCCYYPTNYKSEAGSATMGQCKL